MARIEKTSEVQVPDRYIVQPEPNNYATSQNQQNAEINNSTNLVENNSKTETTTPVIPQTTGVAVQVPSDFNDATVQGYLDEYQKGVDANDYKAQINALNAIDKYRKANGYDSIYSQNIYELTNQRNAKIQNQIKSYEDQMANAYNYGDMELVNQLGNQLSEYKRMVGYSEPASASEYLEGLEYKSSYDEVIKNIVNELLTSRFTYDPSDDEALIKAQEYATNSVYESMNAKGILDSTMTAQIVAKTVNQLIPVYENMAKDDFYKNIEKLQTTANLIMNLDDTQYKRWTDNVSQKLEYFEAKKEEYAYQLNRVKELGYVDNEASIVLGVAPGTITSKLKEEIQANQKAIDNKYNELYSDIALAQAKSDIKVAEHEKIKQIDQKYSNSSGSDNGKTVTNWKKEIQRKLENGEIDEVGAIQEIYSNVKESDIPGVLSDVLEMTENEAKEYYKQNIALSLFNELKKEHENITQDNRQAVEQEVINALDNGNITNEIAEQILAEIEKEVKYNDLLYTYLNAINERIKLVSQYDKGQLKKITFHKTVIDPKLEDVLGEEKYNVLIESVKEAEKDLKNALKSKGIEW